MSDIEKRLIDFRARTYAMAKMQAGLENISIVELIEKAIENYANEGVKMIVNSQYGEWQDRPKKTGRPKVGTSKKNSVENIENVKENTINVNNTDCEKEASKSVLDISKSEDVTVDDKKLQDKFENEILIDEKTVECINNSKETTINTNTTDDKKKVLEGDLKPSDIKYEDEISVDIEEVSDVSEEDEDLLAFYSSL